MTKHFSRFGPEGTKIHEMTKDAEGRWAPKCGARTNTVPTSPDPGCSAATCKRCG